MKSNVYNLNAVDSATRSFLRYTFLNAFYFPQVVAILFSLFLIRASYIDLGLTGFMEPSNYIICGLCAWKLVYIDLFTIIQCLSWLHLQFAASLPELRLTVLVIASI